MKRNLESLKKSLDKKNLQQKSPGQILQGVAFGLPHYKTQIVRTHFRNYLDLSEFVMWDFIDGLLTYTGEYPKILEEKIPVKTTKELYTKIINEIRSKDKLINTQGIDTLIYNFEKSLDENNKKLVNGRLTIFDKDELPLFASTREKNEDKVAEKVSVNLALAYAYNKGIKIEYNYINEPSEEKHIEKSRLDDFFGGRIVFNDMDGLYLHLLLDQQFQNRNDIRVDIGSIKNQTEFWKKQKKEKYSYFREKKNNGYNSFHIKIKHNNFLSANFEMQFLPYNWLLINEGDHEASHKAYDDSFREVIENLPDEITELKNNYESNILDFYRKIKPFPICSLR